MPAGNCAPGEVPAAAAVLSGEGRQLPGLPTAGGALLAAALSRFACCAICKHTR